MDASQIASAARSTAKGVRESAEGLPIASSAFHSSEVLALSWERFALEIEAEARKPFNLLP